MTVVYELPKMAREHFENHRADSCDWCDLWRAFKANDEEALERLGERLARPEWGEADWTSEGRI